ncbi:glycosyltransferase family 4 protein [Spirosoma flavum]|uniref:Glycosyltransferase family 4 protein n=1 Tax=Spirosoma flavum TaxID=2048557 RepID=A0ABW6APN4_9BACT
MKILWVNPSFLDYRIPVYEKINKLTNGNFFLIYARSRVPERVYKKITDAIGDHAIGLSNELTIDIPGTGRFSDTDVKIPYQPGLSKCISKVNADIIIAEGFFQWTPIALLKAKLKRKKILIAYERTSHAERFSPKWRILYRKLISKFIDGYSVNGKLTKDYLIELGVKEKFIFTGGMSADSEKLADMVNLFSIDEKIKLKNELLINNGITYLYVGKIDERKGIIYLLNAWIKHIEKYPNDILLLVGDGLFYNKYVSEYSNFSSIKLLGNIDYDFIYRYYAIADVFIIPTLEDNWSLVVPEAMACGLPIACSIYNGCYPELIHEGINGKLFDPFDNNTILETLSYFHGKDLKRMGNESINIEKKYNADSVALNIYNSCLLLVGL